MIKIIDNAIDQLNLKIKLYLISKAQKKIGKLQDKLAAMRKDVIELERRLKMD